MESQEYNELIVDIANQLFGLNKSIHHKINTYDISRNSEEISELRHDIGNYLTQNTEYLPELVIHKVNQMLGLELKNKKLTTMHEIPFKALYGGKIRLWKGDITTLCTDYIVNAANNQGLGCFAPGHKCIDNVIHANAGPQLRTECQKIMEKKKYIDTSELIMTPAYELPSKYILHVVGPIYNPSLGETNSTYLCKSYINCLDAVAKNYKNMPQSIAFCCISTGVFGYPKDEASDIAVSTVIRWLNTHRQYSLDVIFCVYSSEDYAIYENKMYNI
jgi:O-acetyl-ADP-ribose deacetylase (regulator of RNase III)